MLLIYLQHVYVMDHLLQNFSMNVSPEEIEEKVLLKNAKHLIISENRRIHNWYEHRSRVLYSEVQYTVR